MAGNNNGVTVDLNKSLKEYLSRSESLEKKSLLPSLSMDSWFSKSEENDSQTEDAKTANLWFGESETDGILPTLTKKQRIIGFMGCICMGFFCFTMAGLYAPFLLLKARKFCLLYSMGSLFIIGSFSLLWGPWNHVKHLCSGERLPFTATYFGTMFATLYCALWMRNTILTSVCAICQVLALLWYIISYIPGGQTGLKLFSKLFTSVVSRTASKTLPV